MRWSPFGYGPVSGNAAAADVAEVDPRDVALIEAARAAAQGAAVLVSLPGSDPPQVVCVGTPAQVAELLRLQLELQAPGQTRH